LRGLVEVNLEKKCKKAHFVRLEEH
jgi:hypothetical protein